MNDLTAIICSYKAADEFKLCLHQLSVFGFTNKNIIIYENSPGDYTNNRAMLDKYNITYTDNPGGRHADTINLALNKCNTKYALILDSDCFCTYDPNFFINNMIKKHNIQLYGDICGDRGGLHLHKRVHPWYCYIDVEFLKTHNIPFVDYDRVAKSGSESFYDTSKLAMPRDRRGYYYDVGATMFEDVQYYGGIAADIGDSKPYIHIEGSSWREMYSVYDRVVENNKLWLESLYQKFKFNEEQLLKFVH